MATRKPLDDAERDDIVASYSRGESVNEIRKRLHRQDATVRAVLTDAGVSLRPQGESISLSFSRMEPEKLKAMTAKAVSSSVKKRSGKQSVMIQIHLSPELIAEIESYRGATTRRMWVRNAVLRRIRAERQKKKQ